MNKKVFYSTALKFTLLMAFFPTVNHAAQEYSFGIVPQASGSKLSKLWSPIMKYLEEHTDIDLRFSTTRNINSFEQRMESGKYDFVYMNPYHYIKYSQTQGYSAFAKAKKIKLKGIIVVKKDSPYRTIKDLADTEMAFPSGGAFAANLVPRAVLAKSDIPFSSKYVSSHDSVYRNIARGRYPAGGGVMRTFNSTSAEYRDQLRVLWTSDGYTPHAFAAHPRVSQSLVDKLQKALLDMEQDPKGKELLKSLNLNGIEKGADEEWNDVRALNIQS